MRNDKSMSVFIGRFQPVHKAHLEIIRKALEHSEKVLILIGSSHKASDIKNPFPHHIREQMIRDHFKAEWSEEQNASIQSLLLFDYISDHPYNDLAWVKNVQSAIDKNYTKAFGWVEKPNIKLIGHHKDRSSYYLDIFPSYEQIEVEHIHGMDSTTIRELFFSGEDAWKHENRKKVEQFVNPSVMSYLNVFVGSDEYKRLAREYEFVRTYKLQWANSPYPPTFITADAVVTCLGHILLVTRGAMPGEGLYALPGGFVGQYETVRECALRELREETKIKIPPAVLNSSVVKEKRYDHPFRSTRGRTITTAFHIDLHEKTLPKIKGSDDAASAKWIPLNQFIRMQDQMYEDHYSIITDLLGLG